MGIKLTLSICGGIVEKHLPQKWFEALYMAAKIRKKIFLIHTNNHRKSIGWNMVTQLGLQNTLTASLQKGKNSPLRSVLDMTQSDGEGSVMLELWGMGSTPLLPLLPDPLWPHMVAPDKSPIYGLNRTNGVLMLNWIVWLNWIAWNKIR